MHSKLSCTEDLCVERALADDLPHVCDSVMTGLTSLALSLIIKFYGCRYGPFVLVQEPSPYAIPGLRQEGKH